MIISPKYQGRKCIRCKHRFEQEVKGFAVTGKELSKCPLCGGKTVVDDGKEDGDDTYGITSFWNKARYME